MGHLPSGPLIQSAVNSLTTVVAASGWMASWARARTGLRLLCPGVSLKDPTSHQHLSPITQLPSPATGPHLPQGRPAGGPRSPRMSMAGQGRGPPSTQEGPACPRFQMFCPQLKTQLERTEALLGDEQARRQKLTAEFEEVRVLFS